MKIYLHLAVSVDPSHDHLKLARFCLNRTVFYVLQDVRLNHLPLHLETLVQDVVLLVFRVLLRTLQRNQ